MTTLARAVVRWMDKPATFGDVIGFFCAFSLLLIVVFFWTRGARR